jgi:hypothetical protein
MPQGRFLWPQKVPQGRFSPTLKGFGYKNPGRFKTPPKRNKDVFIAPLSAPMVFWGHKTALFKDPKSYYYTKPSTCPPPYNL